jgi:very-short-patch-repair endonuclease
MSFSVRSPPYAKVMAIAAGQWGLFTTKQALSAGLSEDALRWESRPGGAFERVQRGVYRVRNLPAPALQTLGAALLGRGKGAVACGQSAAWALGLDGAKPGAIEIAVLPNRSHKQSGIRRLNLRKWQVVPLGPFWITNGLTTLMDLADELDDIAWEWMLESVLRKHLATMPAILEEERRRSLLRWSGSARVRRVLALRPPDARPTDSQLETEFIQLIRPVSQIPEPERQRPVFRYNQIVARMDVAYVEVEAYTEVHGAQHRESLPYDANRETTIAATTGWLASEVTAREIRRTPKPTIARMIEFIVTAARRATTSGPFPG